MKLSRGFIFTSLSALSWALLIIATRFAFITYHETAANLAFWITLLATVYWFLIFLRHKSKLRTAQPKHYLLLLFIGLVNTLGVTLVETLALKSSPAINFSFLIRTVILFTIILAAIFIKEKLTLKKFILAILILIGSYLLVTQGQSLKLSPGDLFTLIEALMLGILNISQKTAVAKFGAPLTASAAFVFGLIPFLVLLLSTSQIHWPQAPLIIPLLVIFNIAITQFKLIAFKTSTASYVTMIFSFTPVFVSLIAMPLLKETLTPIQVLGGVLILLAGIGVEKLKI